MTEREAGFGMKKAERRAIAAPAGRQASWRALGLAVAAHSLLFAVLFFGIAWKTTDECKNGIPAQRGYFDAMWDSVRVVFGYPPAPRKECAIQIEMWSPGAGSGANRTAPPEPKFEPVPQAVPQPKPEPKPEPVKPVIAPPPPPPPPPKPAPPVKLPAPQAPAEIKPEAKPDLALERERAAREKAAREKVEREKAEREKAEREKTERAKADKEKADRDRAQKEKLEREKAEREKAEREKAERERLERERLERDKADREKVERDRAERADRERIERERIEREKERTERQRAEREAAEQRRKNDFARDIARSQAEAGEGARPSAGGSSSGALGGGGSSAQRGWQENVRDSIRRNTTFVAPPDLVGNPQVVFRVALSPDCALIRVERISSSGVPSWDQAAERGLRSTNPFPRFPGGQCPTASFELSRRPND